MTDLLFQERYGDIRTAQCLDDIYVLDVTVSLQVVAHRTGNACLKPGESFYSILEPGEQAAVKKYLIGIEQEPLLIKTKKGAAILIANMAYCTGFCLAIFPLVPQNTLATVSDGEFRKFSPMELWKATAENLERTTHIKEILLELHKRILAFLPQAESASFASHSDESLQDLLLHVARYAGCPIAIFPSEASQRPLLYDRRLLCAFLLITLLYCRRTAPKREASVSLLAQGNRLEVKVSFEGKAELGRQSIPEIASLVNCSQRVGFPFRCYFEDGNVCFCALPTVDKA